MATVTFEWFSKAFANEQGGEVSGDAFAIDYLSDTIKCALLTSTAAPNKDTWETWADITNEVVGAGYTTLGAALASKTLVVTPADSWGVSRANSTAYAVGDIVRPAAANTFVYRCIVAGTSGGGLPTYTTNIGESFADGGVTWTNLGKAIVAWDAADPSWATSTITARYAIIFKDTGTAGTSPLMILGTFSADVISSGGTFAITLPTSGFGVKVRA